MYLLLLLIPLGSAVAWLAGNSLEGNEYGPLVRLTEFSTVVPVREVIKGLRSG